MRVPGTPTSYSALLFEMNYESLYDIIVVAVSVETQIARMEREWW